MRTTGSPGTTRTPRIAVALALLVATLASLLMVVGPTAPAEKAVAADASQFQAGHIISDENFYDGGAMNASQVQTFLNAQLRACDAGYTCLRGYAQRTPTMAANAYCGAIQGQASESAASIIARIGAACNISQRYLLVLLQKEQSLVTDPNPVQRQFDRATGFACPDTAPCDASFGGFFYQVYYAARQFNVYARFPTSYNHQPAAWNTVLFNPNSACGSSRIYIQNRATAGLYNYTPYQPNAAAMANLYGTGDGCSAYGNRNTWRMWTDWFGSPTAQQIPALMRHPGTGAIYLVASGQRYHIQSTQTLSQYLGALGPIVTAGAADLDRIPDGPPLDRIVRAPDGRVFLVDDGVRRHFSSCEQIVRWRLSCSNVPNLTSGQIDRLADGGLVQETVRAPDGITWLIQSGTRREVPDASVLAQFGLPTTSVPITADLIGRFPVGSPVTVPGMVVRSADRLSTRIITAAGPVVTTGAQMGLQFIYYAPVVTSSAMNQLTPVATLPTRFTDANGSWLVTATGALRVDPAQYGGSQYFTNVSTPISSAMPRAGQSMGNHFVRHYGSSDIYLVSNGTRTLVKNVAQLRWYQETFNIPSTVWLTATDGLRTIPERSNLPDGTVIRQASTGRMYAIQDGAMLHIASTGVLTALGLQSGVTTVEDSIVNGMQVAGTLSGYGYRCGTTDYVAAAGSLHAYANADVQRAWGLQHMQLGGLCDSLARGAAATQFVQDGAGAVSMLQAGRRLVVNSVATLVSVNGHTQPRLTLSAGQLASIPQGGWVRPVYPAGQLIVGQGQGQVWVVDGTRLLHLGSFTTAQSLGLGTTATTVPAAAVAAFTDRGVLPSSLVQCGTTAYAAVDGRLLAMTAAVRAEYPAGAFTSLSSALCQRLQTSGSIGQLVSGSGRVYWVEDGQRHWLGAAALQRLGGANPQIVAVDATVLSAIPVGATWVQ